MRYGYLDGPLEFGEYASLLEQQRHQCLGLGNHVVVEHHFVGHFNSRLQRSEVAVTDRALPKKNSSQIQQRSLPREHNSTMGTQQPHYTAHNSSTTQQTIDPLHSQSAS